MNDNPQFQTTNGGITGTCGPSHKERILNKIPPSSRIRLKSLAERREAAIESRQNNPGYSYCLRCGLTWYDCHGHPTQFKDGESCFPLCEDCWSETTPVERVPYYRTVYMEWECLGYKFPPERWQEIETSVLAGK